MSGQVLLRGDLASQSPSPLQSWRALLYPRIRQCLAKPLCGLALYLKQKADLAPVAFSLSPSLSVCLSTCLSVHLSTCPPVCPPVSQSQPFVFPSICVPVTSLSLFVFITPLSFISSFLTLHSSSCLLPPSLSQHTHTHHYNIITPTHLLS